MIKSRMRYPLRAASGLFFACCVVHAQTPPGTRPASNPSQQNATRPPGTAQQQPVPPEARPQSNPAAPPGTERPNPQAPPSTNLSSPAPVTVQPVPGTQPKNAAPLKRGEELPSETIEPPPPPPSELSQARPVPPLPSLDRLGVVADKKLMLSINDAIRLALQNNNDIEMARDDVRFAETQLRSLQGAYDPVLTINPQINSTVQPVSNTLGGSGASGTVSTTDFNFNHNITRQFGTGGGQYQFFFNNTRETTNSIFSQLNPFYSSNLGVTFTQPLLRDRSIDHFRHDIRVQRKKLEQSDADFRLRTITVITNVQNAYWDLVFAQRNELNTIANVNLAREDFRRTEAGVVAGSSAPLQRAEIQTEFSTREADLLIAVQNVSVAENTLKQLMLRDPLSPEWSSVIVPTDEPRFDTNPINLNEALQEATNNRPELRKLRLQNQINGLDLQFFKNQTRPRVDIQSTLSTTGLAGNPVVSTGILSDGLVVPPGTPNGQVPLIFGDPTLSSSAFLLGQIDVLRANQGLPPATVPLISANSQNVPADLIGNYSQTLRDLFRFNTHNVVVGVSVQIPLRNKTAEANLAGARIQQEQLQASIRSQEQAITADVRNAAQNLETARRRVLAERSALQSAEQQLKGEQKLYQLGRSTTYLLIQREDQLVNARNEGVRAETDYNKALADLERATSTTLTAHNVVVEGRTGK